MTNKKMFFSRLKNLPDLHQCKKKGQEPRTVLSRKLVKQNMTFNITFSWSNLVSIPFISVWLTCKSFFEMDIKIHV